uniref:UBC core domain-containing protein n=1 Tax=Oryza meridionalis TaxID=40149 RepID=A0A0E0DSH5_9ORYZ
MTFPQNYPNSPPSVRFTSEMWHPNGFITFNSQFILMGAYAFLSFIHLVKIPTVESIVLSIISMLSSPNDESPANIEAAKDWREKRDDFKKKVRRIVRKSQEML